MRPKRSGTRSELVDSLFDRDQDRLWLDFEEANARSHPVKVGTFREDAVGDLLRERLPSSYRVVARAEAVDRYDCHSRDLDLVIFDASRNAVLSKEDLLPAESLLAVVEVKSVLTAAEMRRSIEIARAVRRLSPFGRPFIGARPAGGNANDKRARCFVSVVAYKSSLSKSGWLQNEWGRYASNLTDADSTDLIDLIVVLERGSIRPPNSTGRVDPDGKVSLHHWFVSLANFIQRENSRRPPMDWEMYLSKYGSGWERLPKIKRS